MYAIVRTGGKQYRVEAGRSVVVERLPAQEGEMVELRDVLLIAENGNVTVGTPVIDGARVVAHVEANGRGKKLIVFKYKSKVRSRKKTGHRQAFTRLAVQEILLPGQESKVAQPQGARRRAAEATPAEAETPGAEAIAAPPILEEKPKRRLTIRRPAAKPEAVPKPKPKATVKPKAARPKKRTAKPEPKKKAARTSDKPAAKKPARRPTLRRKKKE